MHFHSKSSWHGRSAPISCVTGFQLQFRRSLPMMKRANPYVKNQSRTYSDFVRPLSGLFHHYLCPTQKARLFTWLKSSVQVWRCSSLSLSSTPCQLACAHHNTAWFHLPPQMMAASHSRPPCIAWNARQAYHLADAWCRSVRAARPGH